MVQATRVHEPPCGDTGRLHDLNQIDRRAALAKQRSVRPERQQLLARGRSVHEQRVDPIKRAAKLADGRLARPAVGVVLAAHCWHCGGRRTSRRPPSSELVGVNQVGAG